MPAAAACVLQLPAAQPIQSHVLCPGHRLPHAASTLCCLRPYLHEKPACTSHGVAAPRQPPLSHCRQQTADQYERYVNRFGPGLVIYWHGYLADLNRVRRLGWVADWGDKQICLAVLPLVEVWQPMHAVR